MPLENVLKSVIVHIHILFLCNLEQCAIYFSTISLRAHWRPFLGVSNHMPIWRGTRMYVGILSQGLPSLCCPHTASSEEPPEVISTILPHSTDKETKAKLGNRQKPNSTAHMLTQSWNSEPHHTRATSEELKTKPLSTFIAQNHLYLNWMFYHIELNVLIWIQVSLKMY